MSVKDNNENELRLISNNNLNKFWYFIISNNIIWMNRDFVRISVIWTFKIMWPPNIYSHVESEFLYPIIKLKRVSFSFSTSPWSIIPQNMGRRSFTLIWLVNLLLKSTLDLTKKIMWSDKSLLSILNLQFVQSSVIHVHLNMIFWNCSYEKSYNSWVILT